MKEEVCVSIWCGNGFSLMQNDLFKFYRISVFICLIIWIFLIVVLIEKVFYLLNGGDEGVWMGEFGVFVLY